MPLRLNRCGKMGRDFAPSGYAILQTEVQVACDLVDVVKNRRIFIIGE